MHWKGTLLPESTPHLYVFIHVPKAAGEGLDLAGFEGEVVGFANAGSKDGGPPTTANPPVQVQFQHKVEAKGAMHSVEFIVHLKESELEPLPQEGGAEAA